MIPVPIHTLRIDTIQLIDQEIHHTIDIEVFPTRETEAIRLIEINDIITDHEIIQTTNQITKDLIKIIIKIDHEIIHKIGTQTITIDKEITLNHLIEIIHVIKILKNNREAIHQNIKDKYIKYKQLKKLIQTVLVLTTRKILNYN